MFFIFFSVNVVNRKNGKTNNLSEFGLTKLMDLKLQIYLYLLAVCLQFTGNPQSIYLSTTEAKNQNFSYNSEYTLLSI